MSVSYSSVSSSCSPIAGEQQPGASVSPAALLAGCDLVPLGDGSYKAIPRKPKQKVTVKEAARIANYPLASIYRLFDGGFIEGERQSPRKIMIHVESLHAHLEAVRDPEFWTHARRQRYWAKGFLPKNRTPEKI